MNIFKKILAISSIGTLLVSNVLPCFAITDNLGKEKDGELNTSFNYTYSEDINNEQNQDIANTDNEENSISYTEEYKEYLKLSEEEKKQVEVIPRKYEVSYDDFFNSLNNNETILSNEKNSNEYNDLNEEMNSFSKRGLNRNSVIAKSNPNENTDESQNLVIPEQYNLKEKINIKVENQGSYGLCWDFASIKPLETYLSLNGYGDFDFSELHIDYLTSSDFGGVRLLHDGGSFNDFEQYLVQANGPVYEEEVPYYSTYSSDDYEYLLSLDKKAYVYETVNIPSLYKYTDVNDNLLYSKRYLYTNEGKAVNYNEDDIVSPDELNIYRNYVKKHIMENGGLYCTIAAPDMGTKYYNSTTNSEYFDGDINNLTGRTDFHAVTIVGWDDNYSKNNFNENLRPKNDGAYLVLNSWGENYGDSGYFYVSYEDFNIEVDLNGIKDASVELSQNSYKKIHFEDSNLYNALKNELESYNIKYDDDKLEIALSDLVLGNVVDLNLSEKGIANISGLEDFYNLYNLDLSKNELEEVEIINSYNFLNLSSLDLSQNKIQNIDLSGLQNIYELNISDNEISDISFISNLERISSLKANNNNIEIMPNINENSYYLLMDLSGNKNIDIGQSTIKKIYNLILSDCNLEELPIIKVYRLDLSNNINLDLSTINVDELNELNLSNCNIDSEKIENMPNTNVLFNLSLSNNPIDKLDFLNKFKLEVLDISNTNISDLSVIETNENAEGLTNLNVSGNKNLQGLDTLTNLNSLYLDNCGLSDLSVLKYLTNLTNLSLENNSLMNIDDLKDLNIRDLNLSNNPNIDLNSLKDLNSLYTVSLNNCEITDILNILNNLNVVSINLKNNKIENIDILSQIEDRTIQLNLDNNKIKNIPNYNKQNINLYLRNQNVEENIELQIGKTYYINFPDIINSSYNDRFREQIIFECENCELDLNNKKIIIQPKRSGFGEARIKVVGGIHDGSVYTINYEMTNDIEKIGIETEYTGRTLYIEGENFDSTDLKVYVIYENGLMEEIMDYELENNINLVAGQESIKIKYENYESNIDIYVYNSETTKKIKFNDQGIYNSFILSTYDYESGLINKDDSNLEIIITKELSDSVKDLSIADKVSDLTGISEFSNLERLVLDDYNSDDLTEIIKLQNLKYLSINNNENEEMQIDDISLLNSLINLKSLILWNTKIKQTNNIYERLGLEQLNISSIYELNELENHDNIVYLPEYYGELFGICENPNIQVSFNCNMDEAEVKIDENQRYYIELDNKEYEDYISNSREAYIRLLDINKGIDVSILISYITNEDTDNPVIPENPDIPNTQDDLNSIINDLGYQTKDSLIIDVKSKTDIESFVENLIGEKNLSVVFLDNDGNELNNDITYIGTGMKLRFKDENGEFILDKQNTPFTYTITVKGDIDGDGIAGDIDALYLKAYRNELQGYNLTEEQIEAIDINSDNLVNYIDSNLLKLHRMEVEGYSLDFYI